MQIKSLQRIITVAAVISAIVLCTVPGLAQSQTPTTTDNALAAQIDQMLMATFKADEPGAAIIVLRNDKPILRKGYGMANLELGVPVAPEMRP